VPSALSTPCPSSWDIARETHPERQTRDGRIVRLSERYEANQVVQEVTTPGSYAAAMSGPQWEAVNGH
jgi:hypothetical protein